MRGFRRGILLFIFLRVEELTQSDTALMGGDNAAKVGHKPETIYLITTGPKLTDVMGKSQIKDKRS